MLNDNEGLDAVTIKECYWIEFVYKDTDLSIIN